MLENVKGFETSVARDMFLNTLKRCGYQWKEVLLNSYQFNIPNSRLRYYCIAKKINRDCESSCLNHSDERMQEDEAAIIDVIPSIDHQLCPEIKSVWFSDVQQTTRT